MYGQFISMLTYQQSNMCQEIFVVHKLHTTSSIVATRESVRVDKEHSKRYGGQASVDNYKSNTQIVLITAENSSNIQSH